MKNNKNIEVEIRSEKLVINLWVCAPRYNPPCHLQKHFTHKIIRGKPKKLTFYFDEFGKIYGINREYIQYIQKY